MTDKSNKLHSEMLKQIETVEPMIAALQIQTENRELKNRNAKLVAALERIRDHDPHHVGLYYDSHLQLIESMIVTAREALQQSTEKP